MISPRHWIKRWHASTELRFVVSGAWNTLFGYLAFLALYLALSSKLHYVLIAVLSHAISVFQSFFIHRRFVFRSTGSVWAEFLRYNVGVAGVFVLGVGGLSALVEFAGLNPLLAQAIVIIVTVVVSFFVHRDFSFRNYGAKRARRSIR